MNKKTPKRLIIDIEESLHNKMKEICVKKNNTIKEFITSLIVKEIIRVEYRKDIDKYI